MTPSMQAALRSEKHRVAKEAIDAKKKGSKKAKSAAFKRILSRKRLGKVPIKKKGGKGSGRAKQDTEADPEGEGLRDGDDAKIDDGDLALPKDGSLPASSSDHVAVDPCEKGDGEWEAWNDWGYDGEDWEDEQPEAKLAKPKSKGLPKGKAKAKAKAFAKAKAKAKAKATAKGKAKSMAKAKASPKAKGKSKKPSAEGETDTASGARKGRKAAGGDWDHPKQRYVWIGKRWLFEILSQQKYGCSSCRFIFFGCTTCRKEDFRGKTAQQMAENEEYQYGLSWLNENGIDLPVPDEQEVKECTAGRRSKRGRKAD